MAAKPPSKSHPGLVKRPSVSYLEPLSFRSTLHPWLWIEETTVPEDPTLAAGEYGKHEVSGFLYYLVFHRHFIKSQEAVQHAKVRH